ncbi:MAG: CdaR family protein [Bryobacterales bacterium]|nr:CdaR family protein [Bryobacterales bacterium]
MRRLFRDFWWKVLSLLIALAMWFAIVGDQERAISLAAPVEMKGIPSDLEISSDAPERVMLEVQGPSSKVRDLADSRLGVILDLSDVLQPGQRTFTVDNSNVLLPQGVRLNRAIPAQIRIRFERRLRKEIPVRVNYSAMPPEGYRVHSEVVFPELIPVEGPETRIRQVTEAETDPIDLSAVVGKKEYRANLYVSDPFVRLTTVTNVTVRVDVGIANDEQQQPSNAPPSRPIRK